MGKIGCKVGQCDSVMDFCVEFRDYGLMGVLEDYLKMVKGMRGHDNHIDGTAYVCAMISSSYGMNVTLRWYGKKNSVQINTIKASRVEWVSKDLVEKCNKELKYICQYLESNKEGFKGWNYEDTDNVENPEFTNMYDFYSKVLAELRVNFKHILALPEKNKLNYSVYSVSWRGSNFKDVSDKYGLRSIPGLDDARLSTGIDDAMLSTGMRDVIYFHGENAGDFGNVMLCEKVVGFPIGITELAMKVEKATQRGLNYDFYDGYNLNGVSISCEEDNSVYCYPDIEEEFSKPFGYVEMPMEEFFGEYSEVSPVPNVVANALEEWTQKGIPVDRMDFVVFGNLFTDFSNLQSVSYFKCLCRVMNTFINEVDEDAEGYYVIYAIVVPDSDNPRTLSAVRWNAKENRNFLKGLAEKYGYDIDKVSDLLSNTPIDKNIKLEGISDTELLELDRQRYAEKRGAFYKK